MADLKVLKEVGEDLVKIFKDLFELLKTDSNKTDKNTENRVVQQLRDLISKSNEPTKATFADRAEAIGNIRSALTEVLLQAAASNQSLPDTTVRIIQAKRNALRSAFGQLLERITFEDIPQLLPDGKLQQISTEMEAAAAEIAQRQKVKDILDTVIKIAITAADIAVKVA